MPINTQTQTTPVPLYQNPKSGSIRLRGNHVEPGTAAFPELDTNGVSPPLISIWVSTGQLLIGLVYRSEECHLGREGRGVRSENV